MSRKWLKTVISSSSIQNGISHLHIEGHPVYHTAFKFFFGFLNNKYYQASPDAKNAFSVLIHGNIGNINNLHEAQHTTARLFIKDFIKNHGDKDSKSLNIHIPAYFPTQPYTFP